MATVTRPPEIGQGGAPGSGPNVRVGAMFTFVGIIAIILMAVMVVTNYALASGRGGGAAAEKVAAAPLATGPFNLDVTATEFKFAPPEITIGGTGDLNITLINKGAIEHDFIVEGIDGKILAPAGQTVKGTFKLAKAGIYTYVCSIPGHKEAGMKGQLVAGSPATTGTKPDVAAYGPAPKEQPSVVEPAISLKPAVADAKPLPPPKIEPPVNRSTAATVKVTLETQEVTAKLADGVTYTFWTFGGSVPGPMVRVRQGDTVEMTLKNNASSKVTHSIDFHSATGPGGGARVTQVPPGQEAVFNFKALNPGVYVYHCATPMVAHHISNGMYGLMVVEPPGGYPKVDREFYVMQGDFYLAGKRGQEGHHEFSMEKMLMEHPEYMLFNGSVGALSNGAMKAKVGETVRIFFGVGGPNITSSFHVIGEIFDKVYPEGATEPVSNVQTTLVPTGGATIVDFKLEVPGNYILVDHSLGRLEKGLAGILEVEGPANPEIFNPVKPLPKP
ncbi:MAG: nitrite reductase, copper-containing [Chloroflexota bacterium]|nr:MAG: nitrite reductase, copper-containing [Chloroflexota bacterium]